MDVNKQVDTMTSAVNDLLKYKDVLDTFQRMMSMVSSSPDSVELNIKVSPRVRASNYIHKPIRIEEIDNRDHTTWHPILDIEVNGNYGYFVLDAIESFSQETALDTAKGHCEELVKSALMGFAFNLRTTEKNDSFHGTRWADANGETVDDQEYGDPDVNSHWNTPIEIEGVDY